MHGDSEPQEVAPLCLFVWSAASPSELSAGFVEALPPRVVIQDYAPEALAEALKAGRSCAVIWREPSDMLAEAMASAEPLSAALERWQGMASGLLAVFRRNRRNLVLLSRNALGSADPETRAQLRVRLGLTGDLPPPKADAGGNGEDLFHLLASLAVPQFDQLRPLLAELEASSLASPRTEFDLLRLERAGLRLTQDVEGQRLLEEQVRLENLAREANLAENRRLAQEAEARISEPVAESRSLRSLNDDLKKVIGQLRHDVGALTDDRDRSVEETALLRDQILLMQHAMDEVARQRDAKFGEMDELTRNTDRAVSKALADARSAAQARARAEAMMAEAFGERDQLRREAEQLEETRTHVDRMASDLSAVHAALIDRENDLAELKASTGAIRSRAERAEADLAEARREKDRLASELAARETDLAEVRALTDAIRSRGEQAEAELAETRRERDQLRREAEQLEETRAHVDRLSSELADIQAALTAREREVEELRASSAAVFASNSWKATAPLRHVSLLLGRHKG